VRWAGRLGSLEFHEDLAGGGFERLDHAGALVGHGLDNGLVPESEESLHFRHGGGRGCVALVQLEDIGDGPDVEAVFLEVRGQVRDGFDVGLHAGLLAVGHEYDPVTAAQDELPAGIVEDLARHGVEVEADLEALDGAHIEGEEVEEQCAVGLRGEADQLAPLVGVGLLEDPLDVRGLAAKAGTVVHDLAVDLAGRVIDEGHVPAPASVAKETVDVFVGDLGERALEAAARIRLLLCALLHLIEDFLKILAGLLHSQADQGEAGVLIEDHHQDAPFPDDGDVEIVLLALMEKQAELFFSDELGEPIRGRHVAGGQGGEAGGVDALHIPGRRNLLPVLVHQEHDLGRGILGKAADDLLEEFVLLLIEHEIKLRHNCLRWDCFLEDTALFSQVWSRGFRERPPGRRTGPTWWHLPEPSGAQLRRPGCPRRPSRPSPLPRCGA